MSSCIAIIPARGGSKRIPKKNIRMFLGKPMIAWTIEAAQKSQKFHRIFVSTDSEEISAIAREYGVEVPFVRDRHSDDFASVSDVTVYALSQVQERLGETYDVVAQLMPNCPIRTADTISRSLNHFIESDLAFQISCFKFGWNNPWWAAELDEHYRPKKLFPEAIQKRSQDLEELYCPTGAIWIARVAELLKSGTFYGTDHRYFPISWREALDIDTEEDWEMAELIARCNTSS